MVSAASIILVLIGTVLGSFSLLFLKKEASRRSFKELWTHPQVWLSGLLFLISLIFYLIPLRTEQVSVLFPFVSASYIWTALLSVRYLQEKMNWWKLSGLVGIIIGIVLVGIGG